MLSRISKKFGITQTEIKIFFFIVVVFIIGLVYKIFFLHFEETPYEVFDYTEENEKFYSVKTDSTNIDSLKNNLSKNDYKNEVLNFSDKNFKQYAKKVTPKEKSLNLNTATFSELINLPGVGDKTAKGIIDYRNKIKKFTNINQLINVDGIGESKLSKIKKFVYLN